MTTNAAGSAPARRRARRGIAGLVSTAVAASGLVALGVAAAPSASAATTQVTNATFTWDLNNEVNAGAFAPGTWNLMSAGKIGNPGAGGQTLKSADNGTTWNNGTAAGWTNTAGNVTIEDKAADGSYAPTTFLGTRQNSAGQNTSGASSTILAETRMVVKNGVGSLDAATDTASIAWDGDATVLFYSGMTYFHLSDPTLTLVNGAGTVKATVGGYATSMDDATTWVAVPDQVVTIATLSGVDVTPTGLAATPAYREVPYAAPASSSPQVTTGANYGSFPSDFVDFQQTLGQGPYWYSTGGAADPRKIANPLTVAFTEHQASVQVSKTTLLPSGAQEVTVTGTGFDPALATGTRPPLAGRPAGAYVIFGKFADVWKPSAGAASGTRKVGTQKWAVLAADMTTVGGTAAGAVELSPQGTFTTTVTVDKTALDTGAAAGFTGNYGIYTYGGGGASAPAYETYTPVTFAKATPIVTVNAPRVAVGSPATATVTVASAGGTSGSVTLSDGATTIGTKDLVDGSATFDLGSALVAGSHELTAAYAGNVNTEAGTGTATLTVGASVQVSKTTLLPSGAQEVTVTGTGFDPALATGTRPPLAGRPAGAYVIFGKFADVWKPSAGAASGTRKVGTQKWAVLAADMTTVGGTAAGAVELSPQGTFTTTVTVDKTALDTGAAAGFTGNYGIYTYPGSGGSAAAYETYTPLAFAKATPTVAVAAPSVRPGTPATATVTVASAGGTSGSVTLSQGGTVVGTKDVDGTGKVSFDLGAAGANGSYPLSASYSGNANTETGTATGALVVASPSVTVSKETFLPTGEQQVTVTGTGFTPAAATGARPPLAGKPSGTYVSFGKFAETWKPSAGAASTSRVTGSVKWAVSAGDMAGIGGDAAGAIELTPEGTFSATLTIDKVALDAKATATDLVNYGIYTYPGGGAPAPSYETFTPVSFAKAVPTVTVEAPGTTYGAAASATVTVTSEGGATGAVTLSEGATVLGTADLTGGTATFDLGTSLPGGEHVLTASFAGNDNTEARDGTATLVVAKAASTVEISVPKRVYGQNSTATVMVAGVGAQGTVTLSRGSVVVGTADLVSGTATFALGALDAGSHPLTASYAGNGDSQATSATGTAVVTKAKSTATVKVTRKPTAKRTGTAQVRITTTPAGSASGSAKLVLRTTAGKVVKRVTVRLNARGIATAKLPKLAKTGSYRLVLTYAGDANVAGSTRTASFKR